MAAMKFLGCLAFILLQVHLPGQVPVSISRAVPPGLKIGFTTAPTLSLQHRYYNGDDPMMLQFAEYWNKIETPRIGFNAGLSFQVPLCQNYFLEGGVSYAEKSHKIVVGNLLWPDTAYIPLPDDPKTIKNLYKKHFIDIPVHIGTTIGKNKLHWTVSAGLAAHYFLNEKYTSVTVLNNGSVVRKTRDEEHNYKALNMSASVKLGLEYAASDRFLLQLAPTFQYGLFEIMDEPVTSKIHNLGLHFSCYYICSRKNTAS